jgi:dihydropteroate synthase
VLKNVGSAEIERFRQQVEIIEHIGEERVEAVMERVGEARQRNPGAFNAAPASVPVASQKDVDHIRCWHRESLDYEPDPAGFFVIQVDSRSHEILVEHYSVDFKLQRALRGKNALEIYSTMIRNNWVTTRGHAAYLGRELGKAELALKRGWMYEQNKELMER